MNIIIVKHMAELNKMVFSCNALKDINTDQKGSIFCVESFSVVNVFGCSFHRITSISNPSCFFIGNNTYTHIKDCFFLLYVKHQVET